MKAENSAVIFGRGAHCRYKTWSGFGRISPAHTSPQWSSDTLLAPSSPPVLTTKTMIRVSSLLCALLLGASIVSAAPASISAAAIVDPEVATSTQIAVSTQLEPEAVSASATLPGSPSAALVTTSKTLASVEPWSTVPSIDLDPNGPLWSEGDDIVPQPIRGSLGAPLMGPLNSAIDLQNPDLLASPSTDHGSV